MSIVAAIGSSIGRAIGSAIAGGGAALALPEGAIGAWYAADYVSSPRPYIPNAINDPVVASSNILSIGRRFFGTTVSYGSNLATITHTGITDQNGTTDATRVVGSAGDWYVNTPVNPLPAGTYKFGVWARSHDGSTQAVRFGNNASMASDTVNGTWKRLSQTIVWGGGNLALIIIRNSGSAAGDVDICDAGLFAGWTDLGAGVADSVPVGNMVFGTTSVSDLPASISGGVLNLSTGSAFIQLPTAVTVTDFTAVAVAAKVSSAAVSHPFFSKIQDYDDFSMTLEEGSAGRPAAPFLGNDQLNTGIYPGLWVPAVDEWRITTIRKAANTLSIFLDDILCYSVTDASVSVSFADLVCGWLVNSGIHGKYKFNSMALWDRALSNAEVLASRNYLSGVAAESGLDTAFEKFLCAEGDSITVGAVADNLGSYANRVGPNAAGKLVGVVKAVTGAYLMGNSGNSLYDRATAVDALLPASLNGRTFILSVLIGANDLASYSGGAAQYITDLAAYCDARRAAGWKVIVCTILPTTNATHNTRRATVNADIATWVGVHADAIADFAGNGTMGDDADASNLTYYSDGVHPTAAGHAVLEPILRAAINGLP